MPAWDAVRVVFFVFVVMLHQVQKTNADEDQTCSCDSPDDGGCATNQLCDRDNNCNKENVAYGKPANISSRYTGGKKGISGAACAAVNGRTGHKMLFEKENGTNCVHTTGNNNAWWQLDLRQNYTITDITIFSRQGQVKRLAGIWIFVDNRICKKLPGDTYSFALNSSIICDNPQRGRIITMSKNGSITRDRNDNKFINFCEVQIWVCKPGLFGPDCIGSCHCENNVTCDNHFGTCPDGCMDGYYGASCSEMCGQCLEGEVCDDVNGTCPRGCESGYIPPVCNNTCENKKYGENCREQCGRCENSAACNVFNGSCQACEENFALPLCKDCIGGYHGDGCRDQCGQCADNDVCDKVTGHCPNGCQTAYQPPYCNATCENKTYGDNCREQCGRCENSAACNVFNGSCQACEGNFALPLCKASEQSQEGSSQGGAIGGAIVAVLVIIALVVVGVILFRRRRNLKKQTSSSSGTSSQPENGRDTSEHPFTSLSSKPEETQEIPTAKPSAAVKPFIKAKTTKTENANAEESHHIYANAPTTTTLSVPTTATNPSRLPEQTTKCVTAPEPQVTDDEEDDESTPMDEAPVYGNVGNVYAQFKATKPELDRIQKYLVGKLASGQLREEFRSIAKTDEDAAIAVGNKKINFKKNRFAQIIPYDQSRVILTDGYSEGTSTDFVNASYISGYQQESKYIAAQGPRDNTVGDLWRMVWQEKITHIVMLTNLKEHGKPKCELYWPEEESTTETYGPVTVTTTHIQQRDNFCIRSFTVTRDGDGGRESRKVTQYHYVSWPDHGVPSTTSLVRFWRYVTRETKHDSAPLLVHCSAGVGRTGTYIGLDIGMDTAVSVGTIDVIQIVTQLRQERTLMVQAVDQYVCLHEALLEAYTARDTVVSLDQFDVIFPQPITARTPNERIDKEFKTLLQMQALMPDCRLDNATQEVNMAKNRSSADLPLDDHIVFLTEHVAGRNQYINAVFMPTFRDPKGSILTQLPLPSTLVDFWRLVYGNDVTTIVSLSSPNEEQDVKSYCQYWPREPSKPVKSGPYTVTLQSQSTVFTTLTLYHITVQKAGTTSARSLRVLHYEGWTGEVGGDTSHMLQLVDTLTTTQMKADTPTLLIQCCDGVGKSGLFSALCDVISHMTYDREIDVYMTVRHMQNVRPSAVTSLTQYRYCYEVAQQRHRDMSIYANT
ncbi:receptor-type tyrosine-protein phosphatase kappa-like isoform X2 [Littorina saxatilis]|uniref:receptor-type tyrosine-protein phosphatase kappa-like isoform X2 n=1 Tax=Littorina saxatilis TaxID=31220 RepID=UPI0038B4CA69